MKSSSPWILLLLLSMAAVSILVFKARAALSPTSQIQTSSNESGASAVASEAMTNASQLPRVSAMASEQLIRAGILLGTIDNEARNVGSAQPGTSAFFTAGVRNETAAATDLPCVPVPLINDKCPAWVSFYDGVAHGPDGAGEGLLNSRVMVPSPDGKVIYVAGKSDADPSSGVDYDYVVIAFDAATGQQRWVSRYPGPADLPSAAPFALVVSPTGSAVFVTGTTFSADGLKAGIATVGFAADTGEQLWVALFNEPSFFTPATDAAVSADGRRVFVAGYGGNPDGTPRNLALTIAYDTATGQQIWLKRYSGDPGDSTLAFKIAANPDGSSVYVAGAKLGAGGQTIDVVLLVYDPVTGDLKKETHHPTKGTPPAGVAVSQDGSRVFIEEGNTETGPNNTLTLAYDALGNELWTARFQGCTELKCSSSPWYYGPIAASPDGSRVFITSLSVDYTAVTAFDTVAYDGATGEQKWVSHYEANAGGCFCGPTVAINRNSEEVYVTGFTHDRDFTTLAYDSTTGARKWVAIYTSTDDSGVDAIAVSPNGDRVFVAGANTANNSDLLTLAYATGLPPPVQLTAATSRKTHGSAGAYDVDLLLTGRRGIECRSGGANGDYTMIFTFSNTLTSVGGASVTSGTGTVNSSNIDSNDAHNYIVNLTGVTNAQVITVGLTNVADSAGNSSSVVLASMGVLLGDTSANRLVNSTDVSQTQSESGHAVTSSNFRKDVNANGLINSTDVSTVQSKSGTGLP